MTDIKYWLL